MDTKTIQAAGIDEDKIFRMAKAGCVREGIEGLEKLVGNLKKGFDFLWEDTKEGLYEDLIETEVSMSHTSDQISAIIYSLKTLLSLGNKELQGGQNGKPRSD